MQCCFHLWWHFWKYLSCCSENLIHAINHDMSLKKPSEPLWVTRAQHSIRGWLKPFQCYLLQTFFSQGDIFCLFKLIKLSNFTPTSMAEGESLSVLQEWILKVREVKSEIKSDSLFSRSEKWNKNLIHSFREVKSEMKMPRDWDREVTFLENSQE